MYFDKLDKSNTGKNINEIEINLTKNSIKNYHKIIYYRLCLSL